MRIIVMGAGAIGGIIGGRLARAGNEVSFADISKDHVHAIRGSGLDVIVPDGSFNVRATTFFPNEIEGKFDVALIAVRPPDTPKALSSLKLHLNKGAILVTLQNGVNPPLCEDFAGPDHAINAVIRMGSRLVAPGHVETHERGHIYVGHFHGKTTPQLMLIRSLLNSVIPTDTSDNILGLRWSKLTYNSLLTFGALADVPLKSIWQSDRNRQLSVDFMAEMVGIGLLSGIRFEELQEYNPSEYRPSLPYDVRYASFSKMALNWKNDRPSTSALKLKRGLKTEVDSTVGNILRIGNKLGMPTHVGQALYDFIREIESGIREVKLDNYDDLTVAVSMFRSAGIS